MIRLPKQWAHWCQRAGLHPQTRRRARSQAAWRNLRGHGRAWRVTAEGQLQCDVYEHFEQWTAYRTIDAPLPKTLREFLRATGHLLDQAELLERAVGAMPNLFLVPPEEVANRIIDLMPPAALAQPIFFRQATGAHVALSPALAA